MRTYMARLGDFRFSIDTAAFDTLQRTSRWRWEAQARIGRKPAQQFTGSDADTIQLSGKILPHFRGGLGQLGTMRGMAGKGEPLPLVYAFDSVGQYCGRWVIAEIRENRTVFFDDGTPRAIEFDISLTEYGEDAGAGDFGAAQATAVENATMAAIANANAGPSVAAKQLPAAAGNILPGDVAGAMSLAATVGTTAQEMAGMVQSTLDSALGSSAGKLMRAVLSAGGALPRNVQQVLDTASAVRSAAGSVSGMAAAIGGLAKAATDTQRLLDGSVTGIIASSGKYSGSSPATLFSKQAGNILTAYNDLSSTASSIAAAANKIGGILNA